MSDSYKHDNMERLALENIIKLHLAAHEAVKFLKKYQDTLDDEGGIVYDDATGMIDIPLKGKIQNTIANMEHYGRAVNENVVNDVYGRYNELFGDDKG